MSPPIDVAKATGMVCTRVPHPSSPRQAGDQGMGGKGDHEGDLAELAHHLSAEGIERVVLESTSDYWRPFFYVLEGGRACRSGWSTPGR